jgi:hypothetical protein
MADLQSPNFPSRSHKEQMIDNDLKKLNQAISEAGGETFADFLAIEVGDSFIMSKSETQVNGKDSWALEEEGLIMSWNSDDERWEAIENDVLTSYVAASVGSTVPPSGLWEIVGGGQVYYSIIPVQGTLQDALETLGAYAAAVFDADNIHYNNTDSGLNASNVNTAIDLAAMGGYTKTTIIIGPTTTDYSDGRPSLLTGLQSAGTPISLLPSATTGKFHDINYILAKFTYNGIQYTLNASDTLVIFFGGTEFAIINPNFIKGVASVALRLTASPMGTNVDGNAEWNTFFGIEGDLTFQTLLGNNPETGDGVLELEIYSREITF